MIPTSKKGNGFSALELIVVIVIMGILGLVVFSFLGNSIGAYLVVKRQNLIYDEGRQALERMAREIRDANPNMTINASPPSIAITKAHASPNDASTNITFRLNTNQLERIGNSSGTTILAGDNSDPTSPKVSQFICSQSAGIVTLELVLTIANGGTVRLRTQASQRNIP